jgi:hypothetical protein
MSLRNRQIRFTELCAGFLHEKSDPLIASAPIRPDLFQNLRVAVMLYMSRFLPGMPAILNEGEILSEFVRRRREIQNVSPNGMLIPKNHAILQFNAVVQAYMDIIKKLHIEKFISSWHIPLNVRFKDSDVVEGNLERSHPTEEIHSDSWAGESAQSVTTMIPLLGDVQRNRVDYYIPPPDFEETWLGHLEHYRDGAEYAKRYTKIDVPFEKGSLNLVDFATLHSSHRCPGAGPRVSIDTTFAMPAMGEKEVIHPWREDERMQNADLEEIGRRKLFVFPGNSNEWVDSRGGAKHPTNLLVRELFQ